MKMTLFDNEGGRLFPNVLDELKPHEEGVIFNHALHLTPVHAGVQKGHAKLLCVLLQRLHRVEAHGLIVHERDEELQRVVAFEPGGLVGGNGKRMGVAFREHVVAVYLSEDFFSHLFRHLIAESAFAKSLPPHLYQVVIVRSRKGAPELVRFGGRHVCHVHDELDYLFSRWS